MNSAVETVLCGLGIVRVIAQENYVKTYDKALEEKWFATSEEDVRVWVKLFYPNDDCII